MAVLYGKKSGSRYNFKNDIQMLLGWIEEIHEDALSKPGETIRVNGDMPLDHINRIRGAAGMPPIQIKKVVEL